MTNLKHAFLLHLILTNVLSSVGQSPTADFFRQLPEYTDDYTAPMVASRLIDGLGFRFYWGTADLRTEDLSFRPSEGARSLEETLDHVLILSSIINATVQGESFNGLSLENKTYDEKRLMTLNELQSAREKLQSLTDKELSGLRIRIGTQTDLPFWNLINGPIADAINHVGQIITFRRTTGNPINPKISVLLGTVKG
jgi:uncharacterized damage-inducible protein DinB